MESTVVSGHDKRRRSTREAPDPQSVHLKGPRCKVDPDHLLGILGIVGTVLNLLVVVLVYIYTPV